MRGGIGCRDKKRGPPLEPTLIIPVAQRIQFLHVCVPKLVTHETERPLL